VTDQRGSPMAGESVTVTVTSGGGSVSGATVVTDASGVAAVGSWTLGPAAGANVLTATSGSLAAVSFTATSTAGVATSLAKNAGDNQTAVAGSAVPVPPSVLLKDANGNAAAGVSVTFAVSSGGGSVTGATVATNSAGIATVGSWILGPAVGANVLSATSGTLTAVSFSATSSAGAASSLAKNAGDNQTGAAGTAIAVPPSVIVKDANNNPVAGVSVTFAVASGGGSITGATVATNSAGIAAVGSWTLGPSVGVNTLTTTSGSLAAVSFTATASAGAAASLTRNTGDGQTAIAGSAVSIAPSVLVKDATGNPTSGVIVNFAVASGGGSVSGAAAVTNSSGIATVGSWSLGPIVGANSLTAMTGNLAAVSFTATSIAGPAASIVKNAGDNQATITGSVVSIPPSVLVTDANGNAKSGVTVTFTVASGGGSITGATPVTNSAGIAAVGSWTLGNSVSTNTLSAAVSGAGSVTFSATGVSALCGVRATHAFGTTTNGTLSSSDCQLPDGSFVDFYNVSLPQAGAYFFRESAAFDTYLLLSTPEGATIAENDDETDTGTNSGIKALLPAGNYLLGPGTFAANVTGGYTVSSSTAPTDVANCEHVFVVKGISTSQNISTTDCNLAGPGGTPIYADGYLIFVTAGTSVTITMSSSIVDSFLQLVTLDGALISQNDNINSGTHDAQITFTATQSAYYAIFARTVPTTAQGPYTLTIQ
jgi:hypothetical protein